MKRTITTALFALVPTLLGGALIIGSNRARSMKRKLSKNGADLIKSYEGLRLESYQDQGGVWTIGYGHTGGVYANQRISLEEAERLFDADIAKFVSGVNSKTYDVDLSQSQFDALVSFAYNVGLGNFGSSTLLKEVRKNPNSQAVADQFRRWVYVKSAYNQGLANRREKEIKLYYA